MPRSKRAKVVHLTQTRPRGRERKSDLIASVQDALDEYRHIVVIKLPHSRSGPLKHVRAEFKKDGRIFFGKNKVVMVALGRSKEEAYGKNLDKVCRYLVGPVALLCTNRDLNETLSFLESFDPREPAVSGTIASRKVELEAGDLPGIPANELDYLRRLKVPVRINKGTLFLERPYVVCEEGDELNSEQCRILKTFGMKLGRFEMEISASYDRKNGKITEHSS